MTPVISSILNTNSLLPHGFCISWTPTLLWLYVIADALIFLSYFTIPLILTYFVWHKKDMRFSWIFILFAAFILACGTTHLLGIVVLWNPIYWVDASMKGVTAIVSVITAIAMVRLIPKALSLPTHAQLNQEIQARQQAYEALSVAQNSLVTINESLEARVSERTRELREKEEYLRVSATVFESQEGMFVTDANSIILRVNHAFTRITGYSTEDALGKTPSLLKSGQHNKTFYAAMWESINDTGVWEGEIWNRRKSGEVYPEHLTITTVKDTNSNITNYVATLTDVTERKQSEAALKESEFRWKFAIEGSGDGVWDWNIQTGEKIFSRRWKEILGYSEFDDPTSFAEWEHRIHPEDKSRAEKTMQDCLDGIASTYTLEFRMWCKDGNYKWVLSRGAVVSRDDSGKALRMIGTLSDVTERKYLELELTKQAHLDHLTGLSNRRHFMAQGEVELSRAIRYDTPLSILMLDIDLFKNVNDTYGHQVGDTALQVLSKICQNILRQVDVAGRLGGEEFAVILPETASKEALEIAERLREAIANTEVTMPVGLPIHFTVSIGVTTLHDKNVNLDMLLNQADKALYEAKETGRNKVCVS